MRNLKMAAGIASGLVLFGFFQNFSSSSNLKSDWFWQQILGQSVSKALPDSDDYVQEIPAELGPVKIVIKNPKLQAPSTSLSVKLSPRRKEAKSNHCLLNYALMTGEEFTGKATDCTYSVDSKDRIKVGFSNTVINIVSAEGSHAMSFPIEAPGDGAQFVIAGWNDSILNGNGTTLVFSGKNSVGVNASDRNTFLITGKTQRFKIKNLRLEYDFHTGIKGRIRSYDGNGKVFEMSAHDWKNFRNPDGLGEISDVKNPTKPLFPSIGPGLAHSVKFNDQNIKQVGYDRIFQMDGNLPDRAYTSQPEFRRMTFTTGTRYFKYWNVDGSYLIQPRKSEADASLLRDYLDGPAVLVRRRGIGGVPFSIIGREVADIAFDNVTVMNAPGTVFQAKGARGLMLNGVHVMPSSPDEIFGTVAAFVRTVGMEGDIVIRGGSSFLGSGDDALFFQGLDMDLKESSLSENYGLFQVSLKDESKYFQNYKFLREGDMIALLDGNKFPLAYAKFDKVINDSNPLTISLQPVGNGDDLRALVSSSEVKNLLDLSLVSSRFSIERSSFKRVHGGLQIASPNGRIANVTIEDAAQGAIRLVSGKSGLDFTTMPGAANVAVIGNRLIAGNNRAFHDGIQQPKGMLSVFTGLVASDVAAHPQLFGLILKNNSICQVKGSSIEAIGASGISILNNKMDSENCGVSWPGDALVNVSGSCVESSANNRMNGAKFNIQQGCQ